jgi:asparagine synthase (glutamine-hydrolysing)
MRHRGSDDEGYAFFTNDKYTTLAGKLTPQTVIGTRLNYTPDLYPGEVPEGQDLVLAHNRLSVIDISHFGHQPMCDEDGRYWITYNGEVYNFLEIRHELIKLGYQFRTRTDSEVVLKAYMQWGEDCLSRFNGMWAFVIYDRNTNLLFASRDRFGVKPFYYIFNDKAFAFASEQKALYHFPGTDAELNHPAVFDYLAMGKLELDQEGLVKGLMELPPSYKLTLDLNNRKLQLAKYYQLEFNPAWGGYSRRKVSGYIELLQHKLKEAIRLRLNSDVPVGTCLSGGIDSSILVCQVNQLLHELDLEQLGGRQKTFTASYKDLDIDESGFAETVVKATDAEWHQVYPSSGSMIEEFEKLVYAQDIPFLSSSTYSQFKVMELASNNGVTVTLDGQGADELFGGYAPHYSSWMMNALKNFQLGSFLSGTANMNSNFSNWKMITSFPAKFKLAKMFTGSFINSVYAKGKPELAYLQPEFWSTHNERLSLLFDKFNSNFNEFLASQFMGDEFKNLMRTGDRNAMNFSIESRMPFADDIHLIESTFMIPSVYKIRNGYSKSLLRHAARGMVPSEILSRRDKVGFATPESMWFREVSHELHKMIQKEADEYVLWDSLFDNWDNLIADPGATTARIWRYINFAVWRKLFKL